MIQITFLTLFLGLGSGPHPVELAVRGPVERIAGIELLLDGAPAGRLAGPPWRTKVDFGPGLLPHELVARALDAEGQEIGRARQWVNLPRPPAEVEIALETAPEGGRPRAALLAWQSLTSARPAEVIVILDGQALPAATGPSGPSDPSDPSDPSGPSGQPAAARRLRVPLPEVDLETAHVLSVEVRFSPAVSAHRDLVFGGGGGEVSTELTAVPVKAVRGKLPPRERLQGSLLGGRPLRPLRIVAVEDEPAELVVVRDVGTRDALRSLGSVGRITRDANGRPSRDPSYLRYDLTLERDARVRVLWPASRRTGGDGLLFDLFDSSRYFSARDGGLHWLLTQVGNPDERGPQQRFTDSVAVAGLQVLAGNGPRAVLLVLNPDTPDHSRYAPEQVRRYLEAIRVPLFVWSLKPPTPALSEAWGAAEDVSSLANLRIAVGRLKRELAAQRVVWVDGLHLPQTISVAPGAGLELAGVAPR